MYTVSAKKNLASGYSTDPFISGPTQTFRNLTPEVLSSA